MKANQKEKPSEVKMQESVFAKKAEDFSSCEYALGTGQLLYQDGKLLSSLSLCVPENIAKLGACMERWPVPEEQRQELQNFAAEVEAQNAEGGNRPGYTRFRVEKDGQPYWVGMSTQTVQGMTARSQILQFFAMNDLIAQGKTQREAAMLDSLTGALNRGTLVDMGKKLLEEKEKFAFVMMDIDGFKRLNDSSGHLMGDELLKAFVRNVKSSLQPGDVIGRVGGDEFVVFLRKVDTEAEAAERLKNLTIRTHWGNNIFLTVSMGVCFAPLHGSSFEELYGKADIAMYGCKVNGGDGYRFYFEGMQMPGPAPISVVEHNQNIAHYKSGMMITMKDGQFHYPAELNTMLAGRYDHRPLWQIFQEDNVCGPETAQAIRQIVQELLVEPSSVIRYLESILTKPDGRMSHCGIGVAALEPGRVQITITDISEVLENSQFLQSMTDFDQLTKVLNLSCFNRIVVQLMHENQEAVANGEYAMLYFDINRFKAINDTFGSIEGDKLLMYIGKTLRDAMGKIGVVARMGSDRFVVFIRKSGEALEQFVADFFAAIANYPLVYEVVCNIGIYVTTEEPLNVEAMIDRANIALAEIKGNYAQKHAYFDLEQRNAMLGEQEIVGMMTTALAEGQFVPYYQPQYDHATGKMVGAEALVRWLHPEKGIISPARFIPIFEKNGFISKLDLYVFEQVCKFQRKCMDEGVELLPISVNRTRYDIFQPDFVSTLESIRKKYDVPANLLHIEITETAIVGANEVVIRVIEQLHQCGYVVEMDDFGSGYSSLNTLKDINLDVLKLDMDFLTEDFDNRGGTILSSVVRMAKWLGLPVIAEGVESMKQANYLQSIGCNYLQGYLYAKPMPESNFHQLLSENTGDESEHKLQLIETLNPGNFWNPESLETLIFSHYVGGAAIFDYYGDRIEILRVNGKYVQEVKSDITAKELIRTDGRELFDEENLKIFKDMLARAIASGEEEECETWRRYKSGDPVCIRSNVRVIGKSESNYIFYEMIRNITSEKLAQQEIQHREKLFLAASEQVNIYYWEYDVATKEMRPCFRCMRDLGLPPLVTNYPEPAIEMGIFPPEVADLYRDMHKKIEAGVAEQEVSIPLTADRVMFRVRYTTEFDENGKPVKAYGSAAIL